MSRISAKLQQEATVDAYSLLNPRHSNPLSSERDSPETLVK